MVSTQPQAGTDRLQLLRTLSIQVLGISKHLLLNSANLTPVTALQVYFYFSQTSTAFPWQKQQLEPDNCRSRVKWAREVSDKKQQREPASGVKLHLHTVIWHGQRSSGIASTSSLSSPPYVQTVLVCPSVWSSFPLTLLPQCPGILPRNETFMHLRTYCAQFWLPQRTYSS